jgi:hypothetical protein
MKKILFVLLLALAMSPMVAESQAGPFLRCDQYTSNPPDYFKVFMDNGSAVQSPIFVYTGETGAALHYDLSSVAVGSHTAKAQACKAATTWGPEVCSADSVPFTFTRPAPSVAPTAPVGTRIVTQ